MKQFDFQEGDLLEYTAEWDCLCVYIKELNKPRMGAVPIHGLSQVYIIEKSEYRDVYTAYLRKINDIKT